MVDQQHLMLVSINLKYRVQSYQHDQNFDSVSTFVSRQKRNNKDNKPGKTSAKKNLPTSMLEEIVRNRSSAMP